MLTKFSNLGIQFDDLKVAQADDRSVQHVLGFLDFDLGLLGIHLIHIGLGELLVFQQAHNEVQHQDRLFEQFNSADFLVVFLDPVLARLDFQREAPLDPFGKDFDQGHRTHRGIRLFQVVDSPDRKIQNHVFTRA